MKEIKKKLLESSYLILHKLSLRIVPKVLHHGNDYKLGLFE